MTSFLRASVCAWLCCGTLVLAGGKLELVAGGGTGEEGGKASEAKLVTPFGVDFDKAGNLYFVELNGHRVGKISPQGLLTRAAGTGEKGQSDGDGNPLQVKFNGMHSLAIAPNGDIFLADTWNNRIGKLDGKSGKFSVLAGTGTKGFSGDGGPAAEAQFGGIYCASLDPAGKNLYLADLDNRRIRRVDLTTGIVTTVAGNGRKGTPEDGAEAASAPLVDPRAVAADDKGNVYVLERGGNALRVVNAEGRIRTLVGTGQAGLSGDGGPALQATMRGPKHLCVDLDGNILLADTENHVIRRYFPATGQIVRVAGTGKKGTAGIGDDPLNAQFNQPHGVFVHPDGTLYISDSTNHRILKISGGGRAATE